LRDGAPHVIFCEITQGSREMVHHRKSLVQRRFWLRKGLISQLEREAKKNDRPLTEEMADRLDRTFERQNWQEEKDRWIIAIRYAMERHPEASQTALLKLKELDDKAERDAQKEATREGDRSHR
jgi:hypothetical protein